jgi:hypothetical protein
MAAVAVGDLARNQRTNIQSLGTDNGGIKSWVSMIVRGENGLSW